MNRRSFLKATGAAGVVATTGSVAGASGGSCGDTTNSSRTTGTLGNDEQKRYTFSTALDEPCEVTYSLSSSDDVDLDLYVTLDGRDPTTDDYDRSSTGYGADEEVSIYDENVSSGSEFGVLVDAYRGSGSFTLDAEEVGSGSPNTGTNEAPDAKMTVEDTYAKPGEQIDFEAYGSDDPDGSIVAYDWQFGDGESATGRTAEHTFDEPGYYVVELTVTDDQGAQDTEEQYVDVNTERPNPSFSIDDSSVKHGVAVEVDGSGSSDPDGSVAEYGWDFGDGTTKTGRTASHSYDEAGQYTITLTVQDDDGATASTSQTVTVESGCGRAHERTVRTGTLQQDGSQTFSYAPKTDSPCEISMDLSSQADADFDLYVTTDGRTPTTDDYDKTSTGDGTEEKVTIGGPTASADTDYGVLLTAERNRGDYELVIHEYGTVENEGPTAKIDPSTTSADEGQTVVFDASNATDPQGDDTIESYEWTFPGGWFGSTTKTGKVVEHSFGSGGSHDVTLTVTDEWGATDTTTVTIDVSENWWPLW